MTNLPPTLYQFAYRNKLCVRKFRGRYEIHHPGTGALLDWTSGRDRHTEKAGIKMCERFLRHGPRRTFCEWIQQLLSIGATS